MAVQRPSDFPEWDINETNTTQPDLSRRNDGWQTPGGIPEKPPYQWNNYQQNLVYKWIKAFEEDGGTPKFYAVDTGAVNVITVAVDAIKTLQDGITIFFETPNANTGATTFTINALTAKDLVINNVALVGGEIIADKAYIAVYNLANDNFELKSLVTEIASTAEAQAGTNNTKMITPLRLREGLNANGSAPVYAPRTWIRFNASTNVIAGSGNVSSLSDLGQGKHRVNYSVALPDANYNCVCGAKQNDDQTANLSTINPSNFATTSIDLIGSNSSQSLTDHSLVSMTIVR